jgi:hypothetical protein
LCVTRWGGDDGPDGAIENCALWPELHALGAPDVVRRMYLKALEGHIRQYTEARTVQVPMARDGKYLIQTFILWMNAYLGSMLFCPSFFDRSD